MDKTLHFEGITLKAFDEQYRAQINAFELNDRQQIYSSLPKTVIDDALQDPDRIANVAINDQGDVVGFFVLHQYYQHEGYDTPENVVYIRSLSINERFQGYGYGTKIMMSLPQYVQQLFPDFNHLYLVVDAENDNAWNLYERGGFMHTATKEEGPIGKERLYYLDLDSKHVSSLRLVEESRSDITNVHIINLIIDDNKVGFIALKQDGSRMNIEAIEVDKTYRFNGIGSSALRQLPTYLRKNYDNLTVMSMILFGQNNEFKALCINSNFVEIEQTEDYVVYEKYLNY
ncbi:GNAT family N-acetyltransferase [Staphylococcus simiae]|uniref:GNAT family N-acetyltransferase n=1 Tax=Staphylococcus simiae TaxID=308354 RepID=UPI001A96A1CB|nr:GNAT family N-acetyltransferase [Staphylococcus simiae]MBO1199161.1 GNAT family N-acetyltransferase [Staphylococcus simiae]MBO1201362.1 GNAT family N-acetyltransferase [Staphylococcus simiae]MBO1203510.1 GNAT family N-acetyltransferase [Staphylococcus simiae]MBO1211038.1 GNAT family N-acetyltransferase [Staphylococcus simiae]MBO1229682.1 GNAT family N-acetyltransferase [Staphylococcus simiae]